MVDFDPQRLTAGAKVLAFDGGGIRGYSSLLIIERVMSKLGEKLGLENTPKPHQVFDIIGGTSTGGLIAILLGRLELSAAEALQAYIRVADHAFVPKGRLIPSVNGKYSATKLKDAVRSEVQKAVINPDELYARAEATKTVVLAITQVAVNAEPTLFRTYSLDESFKDCKIWEIARATSAALTYFKPIECGRDKVEFMDAGFGHNNPCDVLVTEAQKAMPGTNIACIISVGTGLDRAVGIKGTRSILTSLKKMATNSKDVHTRMQTGHESDVYWRFDEDVAASEIEMDDWKQIKKLAGHTLVYVNRVDVAKKIEACVASLIAPAQALLPTQPGHPPQPQNQPEPEPLPIPQLAVTPGNQPLSLRRNHLMYFEVDYDQNADFVDQSHAMVHLEKIFRRNAISKESNVKKTVIYGMGGVGKTQVAIDYAFHCRPTKSVFWINADSRAVLEKRVKELVEVCLKDGDGNHRVKSETLKRQFRRWLEEDLSKWLLIIDNVDDLSIINDFLPTKGHGDILLTTRNHDVAASDLFKKGSFNLKPISEFKAIVIFLCRLLAREDYSLAEITSFTKQFNSSSEKSEQYLEISDILRDRFGITSMAILQKVSAEIDGLPLGLVQSAAYMSYPGFEISAQQYLEELKATSKKSIFDFSSNYDQQGSRKLATVWKSSYDKVRQALPAAANLFDFFAFLDRRTITEDFLLNALEDRTYWSGNLLLGLDPKVKDKLKTFLPSNGERSALVKSLRELSKLSLLEFDTKRRVVEVHKLVHDWLAIKMNDDEASQRLMTTMELLEHHLPPLLYTATDTDVPNASVLTLAHAETLFQSVTRHLMQVPDRPAFAGFFLCVYQWTWNLQYLELAKNLLKLSPNDPQARYLVAPVQAALLLHSLVVEQEKITMESKTSVVEPKLRAILENLRKALSLAAMENDTLCEPPPTRKVWTAIAVIYRGFLDPHPHPYLFYESPMGNISAEDQERYRNLKMLQGMLKNFSDDAQKLISGAMPVVVHGDCSDPRSIRDISKAVLLALGAEALFPSFSHTKVCKFFPSALNAHHYGLEEIKKYFTLYIRAANDALRTQEFDVPQSIPDLKQIEQINNYWILQHPGLDFALLLLLYGNLPETKAYWYNLYDRHPFTLRDALTGLPFGGNTVQTFPECINDFKVCVEDSVCEWLRRELRENGSGSQQVASLVADLKWFTRPSIGLYTEHEKLQVCEKLFQALEEYEKPLEFAPTDDPDRHPLWPITDLIPKFERTEECTSVYERAFAFISLIPGAIMKKTVQDILERLLTGYAAFGFADRMKGLDHKVRENFANNMDDPTIDLVIQYWDALVSMFEASTQQLDVPQGNEVLYSGRHGHLGIDFIVLLRDNITDACVLMWTRQSSVKHRTHSMIVGRGTSYRYFFVPITLGTISDGEKDFSFRYILKEDGEAIAKALGNCGVELKKS